MTITTSAAAGVLDNFACQLDLVAHVKPAADEFLAALGKHIDTTAPVYAHHRELKGMPGVSEAWDEMHAAVRGALANVEVPHYGTDGVRQAKELVGRLRSAESQMTAVERNIPGRTLDVAGIAYSVRSRVDDIVGRGQSGVSAEVDMLRQIDDPWPVLT